MKKRAIIALVLMFVFTVSLVAVQDASAAKKIRWRLQGPFPAGMAITYGSTEFAKKVTAMSGGRLTVKSFPGGAIVPGSDSAMTEPSGSSVSVCQPKRTAAR